MSLDEHSTESTLLKERWSLIQAGHDQKKIKINNYRNCYIMISIYVVQGNKSHIDQTFLLSKILPASYKIIRKNRSLSGGGMFIGYKNSIAILELSNPLSEAEMLWAKLQIPNNRPLLSVFILYTTQ